ncbi:MAG: hypothetical protein AAFY84_15965 [Pseudomonadota bacterium]
MNDDAGRTQSPHSTMPLDFPTPVRRVVICIGAQKAGTSLLFDQLSNNSNVCVPPTKEVHYWDTFGGGPTRLFRRRARRQLWECVRENAIGVIGGGTAARERFGDELALARLRHGGISALARYRDYLLRDYNDQPVVFEASPGYALLPSHRLGQMARFAPDVRLLLIMRDPVERMWSAAKYLWRKRLSRGAASQTDVEEFFFSRIKDPSSMGFRHSAYDQTLDALEKAGCREKLHGVFLETLFTKVEINALGEALGFLPDIKPEQKSNTHDQHFPLSGTLRAEGIKAFGQTYEAVREGFGDRVPESWHA